MDKNFRNEVKNRPGGENINYCYSCGSCTASCPISELDGGYNPRLIIKKTLLGMKEEVLKSDDLWKCIQCHRCVAHCPQNVKFADIMRVLRELSVEADYYPAELAKEIEELDKTIYRSRLDLVREEMKKQGVIKEFIAEQNSGGDNDG